MSEKIFEYLDYEQTRCKFNGVEYEIKREDRYYRPYIDADCGKLYIATQSNLEDYLQTSEKEPISISYCIFVEYINLNKIRKIDKKLRFNECYFIHNVDFCFDSCNSIYFYNIKFYGQVHFSSNLCLEEITFSLVDFYKEVKLINMTIEKNLEFREVNFYNKLEVINSKIRAKLFFGVERFNQDFSLNLKYSNIECIIYENTEFKKAENRETFLILKQQALKNHDQIKALEFYEKEMKTHKDKLSWKKDLTNKIILNFEWGSSYFGTKPFLSLFWILFLNLIFVLWLFHYQNFCVDFSAYLLFLNPTSSVKSILKCDEIPNWIEAVNFIKNIFIGILIYEMIKSFRKFSRKL